jgi:ribosomal protein L18E
MVVSIDSLNEHVLIVRFSYSKKLVEKIRQIEGRRWHEEEVYWTIPNILENILKS